MKTHPKEIIKITVIILVIISLSYGLYFTYSYYFEYLFQPASKGIGGIVYLWNIFVLLSLLAGTTYYIRTVRILLSLIIDLFKKVRKVE